MEFTGTILLVSHDRTFLDNVVSSTLVFEPGGQISEYVGGFDDWLRQGGAISALVAEAPSAKKEPKKETREATPVAAPAKKKLSYKLQRELDGLPGEIEALEEELAGLETKTAEPDFYQQDQATVESVLNRLTELNTQIEEKMERWEELDSM